MSGLKTAWDIVEERVEEDSLRSGEGQGRETSDFNRSSAEIKGREEYFLTEARMGGSYMMNEGENATFDEVMTRVDSDSEQPPSSPILFSRHLQIRNKRKMAKDNLQKQASEMLKRSREKFPPGKVGDTVKLRIPDVDRGRCAPRNVIGVITNVNDENGSYKVGTKFGTINTSYTRNDFTPCPKNLLRNEDVPSTEVSLRECAGKFSVGGGQGYKRCQCKTGCGTDKCSCHREKK